MAQQGIENIGKRDIAWSYASTLFLAGAWVLLFILRYLPQETVGIWHIFQTITTLVVLLDFGFRPSFARNISYIFSGVKHLQKTGIENTQSVDIDYSLLKGTLVAMKRFYRLMALAAFVLLASLGTLYLHYEALNKYSGDHTDAIIAWIILIVINCYNLYTLYYDALLLGKGYVKRSQQITIIGQTAYLVLAIVLIFCGLGLTAIVSAQLISIIIRRVMSYRVFFTKDLKEKIAGAEEQSSKHILNTIFPNAMKVGLTQLGGFCVNQSATLIGTHYLTLADIGSYGITLRIIILIAGMGTVIYQASTPKLAQHRVTDNKNELKRLYGYSVISLVLIMLVGGAALVFLGDWAITFIGGKTHLLPTAMILVMLVIQLLEQNHAVAAGFIMADNKIPFFIPSLVSGAATILLLWVFLGCFNMGLWGMILAPGIAQLAYQNWKWPYTIIKELK